MRGKILKKTNYDNNSISMLKGEERVRLRPGVIFGSDDLEGCIHGFFEIISNSTDEAKAGYGNLIEVTRFSDGSIQVEDHGRGIPMDWNESEGRYNWELCLCELYAGSKYDNSTYDYSLGLNGLGAAATQYASEWFDVTSVRDGYEYSMHFEKGKPVSELGKKKAKGKPTGTIQRWKPDSDVFTETDIPLERFQEILKQQAIVNAGITYTLHDEESGEDFEYLYPDGILGYVEELTEGEAMTTPFLFSGEGTGRDRADKEDYFVKADVAFCFSNKVQTIKYFHNSSFLEHGGSPDKATRQAMVSAFDKEIKVRGKYTAKESKITFGDIQDSLVLVINSFSTQTSYENQTKKSINNKFIYEFLSDLIKTNMQVWFIEHKPEADKIIEQVLINKRSREQSESQRITVKKKLMEKADVTNKVKKFVDCREKDPEKREVFICLKGDTKVKLLDGTDREIASLVGEENLWGYSSDEIGRMIPARISKVFKTGETTDMIRLTFSDGSVVECTPEHRFLDKDSLRWVEAQNLNIGQSLASMKFKIGDKINTKGRPMVWVPETYTAYNSKTKKVQGHWELIHRRVAKILGISHPYDGAQKKDVHHKDGNKCNNHPDNLEFVTPSEHRTKDNYLWHASGKYKEQFENMPEESRERMRNGVYQRTPEGIERQKQAVRESWAKDPHNPNRTWAKYNKSEKFWQDVERNKAINSAREKERRNSLSDEEKAALNEKNRIGQYRRYRQIAIHFAQRLIENGLEINEENWEQMREKGQLSYKRALSYFGSYEAFLEEVKNYNLKVVNIERITYEEPIPVYCLTIESDFHSFVLENGIITHNCEGDSAAGSLLTARNPEFQALMPIRGKILNIQKASLQSVFGSDIIMDLIRVLGCGVEVRGKKLPKDIPQFDEARLKFNKIIMACDADVDGYHIICLITTMIYKLCPQIIEKGYLYYAMTPLFEITDRTGKKPKTLYAFSDAERDKMIAGKDPKKLTIQRSKGLGENSAEVMARFITPGTRKLVRVTSADAKAMEQAFNLFMGNDVAPRKSYIEEHFDEYDMEDLDIN